MTNLEELKINNAFSDRIIGISVDTEKARTVLCNLINDYSMGDLEEMGKKLKLEAPTVITLIQIAFDYVVNTDDEINTILKELSIKTNKLREICITNNEISDF